MSRPARGLRRGAAFVVVALGTCVSILSAAQPRKPGKPVPAAPAAKKPPARPPAEDGADAAAAPLAASVREAGEPTPIRDGGKGGAVVDQKTVDGGGRVFRFGEVEVEGRLKSPQIVYFLRRVRAEFAAGDLGHRSFVRELGETKNEPGF
jgi:hypothetical protein